MLNSYKQPCTFTITLTASNTAMIFAFDYKVARKTYSIKM